MIQSSYQIKQERTSMSEIWIEIEDALEAGVDARSIAKNLLIPIEWVYTVINLNNDYDIEF